MDFNKAFDDLFGTKDGKRVKEGEGDNIPIEQKDFFGRLRNALLGTPDSELSPEELRKRNAGRTKAIDSATAAWQNPGESYMDPPSGSDLQGGLRFRDLVSAIGKLF